METQTTTELEDVRSAILEISQMMREVSPYSKGYIVLHNKRIQLKRDLRRLEGVK